MEYAPVANIDDVPSNGAFCRLGEFAELKVKRQEGHFFLNHGCGMAFKFCLDDVKDGKYYYDAATKNGAQFVGAQIIVVRDISPKHLTIGLIAGTATTANDGNVRIFINSVMDDDNKVASLCSVDINPEKTFHQFTTDVRWKLAEDNHITSHTPIVFDGFQDVHPHRKLKNVFNVIPKAGTKDKNKNVRDMLVGTPNKKAIKTDVKKVIKTDVKK